MHWMPDISKANLRYLVGWWVFLLLILLFTQWRGRRATGLPLAYAMNLSLIHLFGAIIYCFDYYTPRSAELVQAKVTLATTYVGFWVSLIGFGSFVVGSLVAPVIFPEKVSRHLRHPWPAVTTKLPGTLLIMACLFFFFLPVLSRIPSMASIASAGTNCSILAVMLFCYFAFRQRNFGRLFQWLASTSAFPVFTIIFMGFAGYGINAALTCWQLIFRFLRPRWLCLLLLSAMLYGGVTLYVNYMRERNSIRETVWAGRGLSSRLDRLWGIVANFQVFMPYEQSHLEIIDGRLNQNDLVGKSVEYIRSNRTTFAEGGTIVAAAIAMIPRIIWPNKPVTAGSGSLATRYTGQIFAEGTSVGIGHVMEFYINWGMPSVIVGFLVLGISLRYLDMKGAFYFHHGDYWNFTRWALPALGMMQSGGVLAEMVGTMAASYVLVQTLHYQFFAKYYDHQAIPAPHELRGRGSKHHL